MYLEEYRKARQTGMKEAKRSQIRGYQRRTLTRLWPSTT